MSRLRLLLAIAGVGTLLAGVPAGAVVRASPGPTPGGGAGEERALRLLGAAATAARSLSYSGTQYVSTWRADAATSHVADIRHTPGSGSVVSVRPTAGNAGTESVTLASDLDMRLLRLLAEHYVLDVAGEETWTGRTARVVDVKRPGVDGDGAVAGRFWLDGQTSLVLRREVFDREGHLVRSSAYASLTVSPSYAKLARSTLAPQRLSPGEVEQLRADGWPIPAALPGDLELYDAKLKAHDGKDVLHLSYSDGLSTLSLFAQRGRLGSKPVAGFAKQRIGRAAVWVRSSPSPQRVVWGGSGRVFTVLTDAPPDAVRAVVQALPHDRAPKTGVLARLARGIARLGSWLNPFD